jgi:hypothetical protein
MVNNALVRCYLVRLTKGLAETCFDDLGDNRFP